MAVERIQLVANEILEENEIKRKVEMGEIKKENFEEFSPEIQMKIKDILFDEAKKKIDIYHGVSSLEFILMGSLRIMRKEINKIPLTQTEVEIKKAMERITCMHELSNPNSSMEEWEMDYLAYAEANALKVLENRKKYIETKGNIL